MIKKKGFTLFELLVIILILSMLGGAGIVVFISTLQESKENKYNMMTEQIIEVSKVYVESNNDLYSELKTNGFINIKVGELQEAGFIDWNLVNPITEEDIPSDYFVNVIQNSDETLTYQFRDEDYLIPPSIELVGASQIYVSNGVYTEQGATAFSTIDGDITNRINVSGSVNPLVTGTYVLNYSVTSSNGLSSSVERTVFVVYEPPTIELVGLSELTHNISSGAYVELGAVAYSLIDGEITDDIVITGSVNSSVPDTYILVYSVEDSTGISAEVTRTVTVVDDVVPTVEFSMNGNSTYAKNRSTTVTVSDVNSSVNTSSLKYQWTTNTSTPSEASFSTTFINGSTISTPAISGSTPTGSYYLWIIAKDSVGNTIITRTNVFNMDNTPPSISVARSPGIWTTGNVTLTPSCSDANSAITSCTPTVSAKPAATTQYTFTATDAAGNTNSTQATITRNMEYRYTDKYVSFNGSSSYLRNGTTGIYGIFMDSGTTPYVFEAGVYLNSVSSDFYFFDAYSDSNNRFALWYNAATQKVTLFSKYNGKVYFDYAYSCSLSTNTYFRIRIQGGTDADRGYSLYIDDVYKGKTGSSYRFAFSDMITYIGRRYTTEKYLNGRIYWYRFQARKSGSYDYVNYYYPGSSFAASGETNWFPTGNSTATYRFDFYNTTSTVTTSGWSTTANPNWTDDSYFRTKESRPIFY